jgi:hypothetical protein
MARVSDVELERLKRDVSLVRLCEAKGVALTRQGPDNLVGLCPFHEQTTGSFVVSPSADPVPECPYGDSAVIKEARQRRYANTPNPRYAGAFGFELT